MNPIFIIGTERSGTNLLRLILNAHSNIAVPHPPHIVKFFHPLETHYGDLDNDRNFRRLIDDVCRLVELHTSPWQIRPDREQVFHRARGRRLICVYFEIYQQYLEYTGKTRWGCKSTFMLEHVAAIREYYPDARFFYMVRDGRDVAVSAKSSIFNDFHVFYSAGRWQREQALGLSWLSRLPQEQIRLVKYEELLAQPQAIVQSVCAFLGEKYEEQMLDYHRSAEARKLGDASISWANSRRPVLRDNAGRFRHELSRGEIRLFEAIAHKELVALGYTLDNPRPELEKMHAEAIRPRLRYWLADQLLGLRAQAKHLIKDKNSLLRLKKSLFMTYVRMTHAPLSFYASH